MINNTSGDTRRYHLVKGSRDNAPGGAYSTTFDRLAGSAWGENSLVAYPMN